MTQVWDWLVAVSGGSANPLAILKTLIDLIVYFVGFGFVWM